MNKQTKRPIRRDVVSASQMRGTDFNPDYSYVKKDLRRIGALAGTFMVILIVLSFFLR